MTIGEIIGIATGSSSLLIWAFVFGIWKGRVDKVLEDCSSCHKTIPQTVTELNTKMDLVWKLVAAQILEYNPHLAKRDSPFKLTERGKQCLIPLQPVIVEMKHKAPCYSGLGASDVLLELSNRVPLDKLYVIANAQGCTPAQLLAMATIEMGIQV